MSSLCDTVRMTGVKLAVLGIFSTATLMGGLLAAAPASATAAQRIDSVATISNRAARTPKPGAACTKKQKNKTIKNKYGKLKCTKKGKKYVWKKAPTPAPAPTPLTCATGGTCTVGQTGPGGGTVFYVAITAQPWGRYLEAAPSTWDGGSAGPLLQWCNNPYGLLPGIFRTAIGTGGSNTTLMVAGCTSGAGNAARSYRGGGKSDWSLPSKDELQQMYVQRDGVGGFTAESYWSSSQSSAIAAWYQFFADGNQTASNKYLTFRVRPVRAF